MNGTPRALLIDPDDRTREVIRQALAASGRVGVAEASASYQGGVGLLGSSTSELVVINLDHDREAALRVLRHAAALDPRVPVLPASADPDSSLVLSAMRTGAREFLVLPPDAGELAQILDRLLRSSADGPAQVSRARHHRRRGAVRRRRLHDDRRQPGRHARREARGPGPARRLRPALRRGRHLPRPPARLHAAGGRPRRSTASTWRCSKRPLTRHTSGVTILRGRSSWKTPPRSTPRPSARCSPPPSRPSSR